MLSSLSNFVAYGYNALCSAKHLTVLGDYALASEKYLVDKDIISYNKIQTFKCIIFSE